MTQNHWRKKTWTCTGTLGWLKYAPLFLAVFAFGCADAPPHSGPADTEDAAVTSPVNIFGEFGDQQRSAAMPAGEAGYQQHTYVDEGYDADVDIDATGHYLVFASTRHNVHSGIYLQRVDGTSVTRLTADDSDNAFPTFSPDGRQIAFCSTRSGNWNIYTMDVEGRNVTQVTTGTMQSIRPSFSPDGTRIAYCALGERSNQWELWVVNLTTNEHRMIGYGLFPSWSPSRDIDRIAFQQARQRGSRWFSLWTLDLVDGEARHVTEVAVSSNAAIVTPAWSPDGRRLVFATVVDPDKAAAEHIPGQQDIWTINLDGTNRRRLTDGNGVNLTPVWAVDNRVYFISDRGGHECVWSVRTEPDKSATADAAGATPPPSGADTKATGSVGSTDTQEIGR